MEQYYLAIDIGASSGRHILGHMEDGKMVVEQKLVSEEAVAHAQVSGEVHLGYHVVDVPFPLFRECRGG
jgi:sugar (pentulose or hexulose) kinase